jgi:hypothetical protein
MKNFIIVREGEERFAAAVMSWEGRRSYTRGTGRAGVTLFQKHLAESKGLKFVRNH